MADTRNYHLHLTDSSSEPYLKWRDAMNGVEDSNMIKIDTALGEKAERSGQVQGVLRAGAWTGVDAPFTQEIEIEGLGATQNGDIAVAQTATFEERQIAREAMLALAGQSEGKLIVVADGELPTKDIPFVVTLLG